MVLESTDESPLCFVLASWVGSPEVADRVPLIDAFIAATRSMLLLDLIEVWSKGGALPRADALEAVSDSSNWWTSDPSRDLPDYVVVLCAAGVDVIRQREPEGQSD